VPRIERDASPSERQLINVAQRNNVCSVTAVRCCDVTQVFDFKAASAYYYHSTLKG